MELQFPHCWKFTTTDGQSNVEEVVFTIHGIIVNMDLPPVKILCVTILIHMYVEAYRKTVKGVLPVLFVKAYNSQVSIHHHFKAPFTIFVLYMECSNAPFRTVHWNSRQRPDMRNTNAWILIHVT